MDWLFFKYFFSNILHVKEIEVVKFLKTCDKFINRFIVFKGTSVCNGDSGGGIAFPRPNSPIENPVWQIRGMVSISVALQNQFKCDASHYVVFTDIAKYLDWVKSALSL